MLDFTGESIIVRASILVGMAGLALTAAFLATALLLRRRVTRAERRAAAVDEAWLPRMLGAMGGDTVATPRLARRDVARVLARWNRLVAGIEGAAADHLRHFARDHGLDRAARRLLAKGSASDRLVAATFLGHNRDLASVRALQGLVEADHVVTRAEAARALVRLDPAAGVRVVVPLLVEWDDVHPATAAAVLASVPQGVAGPAVAREAARIGDHDRLVRLVELMRDVGGPDVAAAARGIIERVRHPEVMARCLDVLGDHRHPEDSPLVARFLHHREPFVRLHAVAALGRIMGPGDAWRLVALLDDRDWWVRRRSAHALVDSPKVAPALVQHLSRVHPDPYARDALHEALSMRALQGAA